MANANDVTGLLEDKVLYAFGLNGRSCTTKQGGRKMKGM